MRRSIPLVLLFCSALITAQTSGPKRPMTFEDMMHMKRLGSTAVSSDGKWLGYSVTSVDLEKNTKTPELFIQPIDPGNTKPPTAVGQPGDSGIEFAPDDKHILFLSSRELASQQVYTADFDTATGATTNVRRVSPNWDGADNAKWAPDSQAIV